MLLVSKAVALATECCIVNALRARMNRLLRQNAERICNTAVSRGNGFRIGAQMEQLCIASDAVIMIYPMKGSPPLLAMASAATAFCSTSSTVVP